MTPANGDEPATDDVQRIRASFDCQGLVRHLGARLSHIGTGRVHIVLPHRPEITQQHGVHPCRRDRRRRRQRRR